VYRVVDRPDSDWFWGVSFQLTGRKSYGHAPTLDQAKAAFKAEYLAWKAEMNCKCDAAITAVEGYGARRT
jgi:hypothetical protein